jgi:hypothetical protein
MVLFSCKTKELEEEELVNFNYYKSRLSTFICYKKNILIKMNMIFYDIDITSEKKKRELSYLIY